MAENIDWQQLDMIRESFSEEFSEVYQEFLREIPQLHTALREAVAAGQVESAAKLAHQIKGTAANFGFGGVSAAAAALETQAKAGSLEGAAERLAEGEAAFQAAVTEVKSQRGV
jgi:HPt (histidine-containing phosphotransfer) domain-containing protein